MLWVSPVIDRKAGQVQSSSLRQISGTHQLSNAPSPAPTSSRIAHGQRVRAPKTGSAIRSTSTARNVLEAMAETGTGRIVFASSAHVYGEQDAPNSEQDAITPLSSDGTHKARVEEMLAASGAEWVAIRSALILGRGVDNWVRRLLALPAFPDGSADRRMPVVHLDDALRLWEHTILNAEIAGGPVNLAAVGARTFRQIAAMLGRPIVPLGSGPGSLRGRVRSLAELEFVRSAPLMDTSWLRDEWGLLPAWNSEECVEDFALAVRGRVTVANRVISLPWRLANIQDLPAVDAPASDGVVPRLAGPEADNGEFDTPIDPRFPTFLATNLSEALPGPFSPSSASATVRGLRAGGVTIAERLRPGG